MTIFELRDLVGEYFGAKATDTHISEADKRVVCILYDSFMFECNFNGRYGAFGGGVMIDSKYVITTFLGESISHNTDKESILSNFAIVDEFCRMRLPDKFLRRYEEALYQ
jgi:hypothetical protein